MPTISYVKPAIDIALNAAMGCAADVNRSTATGMLRALSDNGMLNMSGVPLTRSIDGTRMNVQFYFTRPTGSGDVRTGNPACTDVNTCSAPQMQVMNLETTYNDQFCISDAQLDTITTSMLEGIAAGDMLNAVPSFLADALLGAMTNVRERIDQHILQAAYVGRGINLVTNSNVARDLTVLDAAGNPLPIGVATLINDMPLNLLNCAPVIVGYGNFNLYSEMTKAGCCNSFGVNTGEFQSRTGYSYYKDTNIANPIVGGTANQLLVFAPKAFHAFTGTRYTPESWFSGQHGISMRGQIQDPFYLPTATSRGIQYDLEIRYDDCARTYTFSVIARVGVYVPDVDRAVGTTANWVTGAGVSNGILLYNGITA